MVSQRMSEGQLRIMILNIKNVYRAWYYFSIGGLSFARSLDKKKLQKPTFFIPIFFHYKFFYYSRSQWIVREGADVFHNTFVNRNQW